MKLFFAVTLSGLLVLMVGLPVLAAAAYRIPVTVANTSGSSFSMLPITISANNTAFIAGGYITATALDTRVTDAGTTRQHMVAGDRTLAVIPINNSTTKALSYTTGNTPLTAMPIITGYNGYVSTTAAIIPAGQNIWDFEGKGWFLMAGTLWLGEGGTRSVEVTFSGTTASVSLTLDSVASPGYNGTQTFNATGLATGYHTFILRCDGTNYKVLWDGVEKASVVATVLLQGSTLNVNTIASGNSMAYVEYVKTRSNSVEKVHFEPNTIISGTTLPDLDTGDGAQNGTITWGANPANVTVTLGIMTPANPAQLSSYSASNNGTVLSGSLSFPPQMYTELDVSKVPGGAGVSAILAESETPQALWWFPFMFIGFSIIGMLAYDATQRGYGKLNPGNNEGSLLVMALSIEVLLVFFGVLGATGVSSLLPLWPAWLFPIPAAAIVLSRKHYGWG